MKHQIFLGTVFAAAMAVSVGAQSTQSTTHHHVKKSNAKTVIATGCLQSSGERGSATGTSGTTSPKSASAEYKLTDAIVSRAGGSPQMAPGASGGGADEMSNSGKPAGTEPGTEATKSGQDLLLVGQNLDKHAGHKVTVQGRWSDSAADQNGTRTLQVKSVRAAAGACSGK